MQNSMVQKAFMIFSHVLMSYSEKTTNKTLVPLITVNDNDFACQTIPRAHQKKISYIIFEKCSAY